LSAVEHKVRPAPRNASCDAKRSVLKGYRVVDTEEIRRFSDHNIVVIDLEL
jgi:hypothetical protein